MNTSLTGIGAVIVTLLNFILPAMGFDVPVTGVESFVVALLNVAGFVSLIYGQARRKEVKWFIFK